MKKTSKLSYKAMHREDNKQSVPLDQFLIKVNLQP